MHRYIVGLTSLGRERIDGVPVSDDRYSDTSVMETPSRVGKTSDWDAWLPVHASVASPSIFSDLQEPQLRPIGTRSKMHACMATCLLLRRRCICILAGVEIGVEAQNAFEGVQEECISKQSQVKPLAGLSSRSPKQGAGQKTKKSCSHQCNAAG